MRSTIFLSWFTGAAFVISLSACIGQNRSTATRSATDFSESSLSPEHAAAAKELQGKWTVTSFHEDGKITPIQEGRLIPYTFEGSKIITVGPLNARVEI